MIQAIIYTSNAGSTARYARMLGQRLNLPAYDLKTAKIEKGAQVIFLGWLMAGSIKGYKAATKKYSLRAVCAVGMAPSGALADDARSKNAIPQDVAVFTLQGNFDLNKLRGLYRLMMKAMIGGLQKKESRTEKESAMLQVLTSGVDYVQEGNLSAVLRWAKGQK